MANRLIHETSPYLLQHANNPVDWYAWGEEALSRARIEEKPILLSIGYSACHWCHVMERESFENQTIAKQMNAQFVCIKVDREERPDLDSIYMQAVQALTGHGGWPMTVFLTADGRPFYGGTYFPPEDRHGMPGFNRVLNAVAETYNSRYADVLQAAETLTARLKDSATLQTTGQPLEKSMLDEAYQGLLSINDDVHGGFGDAPKFPQPMVLEFLLRYYRRTGKDQALRIVEQTLESMAFGGIYDQIGGGFHRYTVDSHWLVPHFEKMLYDNALLVQLYLHAYQLTGKPLYRRIVEETLDYLLREMWDPQGGFHASEDADSEGEEGKYYLWDSQDIELVLGKQDVELFNQCYGVTIEGNFENRNILSIPFPPELIAESVDLTEAHLLQKLGKMRERMRHVRDKRVHPMRDDKVLTAWNAMTLKALACAASVLDNNYYRQAAEINGEFLLDNLYKNNRLLRTWRNGKAHLKGYLEDYSLLISALLSLHEATFSHRWLLAAKSLTDEMLTLFWSTEHQALFDVGSDHEALVIRPKDIFDNATPSGSSVAAEVLLHLGRITGDDVYINRAECLINSVQNFISKHPMGFGHWLCALDLLLANSTEIAIVGNPILETTSLLVRELNQVYLPNRTFVGWDVTEIPIFTPLLEGRSITPGKAAAYVCHNYACTAPTGDPVVFRNQLQELY